MPWDDAIVGHVNQFPVPFAHSIAAVARDGRVIWEQGDVTRIFPLASVTKIVTSLATLRAVQSGIVSLATIAGSAPQFHANSRLGSSGALDNGEAMPFTLAHLLSHSSGLAAEGNGMEFRDLPGMRRIYSNQGFDVLGDFMREKTGAATSRWIDREVAAPLGLRSTTVPSSPARSGFGSALDLTVLAEELLEPQLLTPKMASAFSEVALPGLRGILPGYGMQSDNTWGLGVEIEGAKQPHWTPSSASPLTFGHFGMSGSFLWVDPQRGIGAVFLGAEPFGPWHKANWPILGEKILEAA